VISFASWSVLTVDFLVILHLAMAGVTFSALLYLVNAKWRYDIRLFSVSFFALFPLAFVLLLILLWGGGMTFPWVGIFEDLPRWNHLGFLAAREIIGFFVVGVLFTQFIRYQARSEDSPSTLAILIPFAHVLFATMVAWDFEMTLLPGWESSIYGIYHFVSCFGLFLAISVLFLYFLDRKKKFIHSLPQYLYNNFAQMMLAFSILWVYTFFAQYLIIWYGNLPEETGRLYQIQYGEYQVFFWGFFILKFVIPFSILVFPYSRYAPKIIAGVACSIALGTWIERYTWIAGVQVNDYFPMTSLFDMVVTILVFGLGIFLFMKSLRRNKIIK
jgi:hypothetical protein